MKQFDIEAVKKGKEVVTRLGNIAKVTYIGKDFLLADIKSRVGSHLDKTASRYRLDGRKFRRYDHFEDLFMK